MPVTFFFETQQARPKGAGIWWCTEKDYAALRALFTDGDRLPPTWEAWKVLSERAMNMLIMQGTKVEPITLEPKAFASWCKSHKIKPDSQARMRYAAEGYRKKFGKKR